MQKRTRNLATNELQLKKDEDIHSRVKNTQDSKTDFCPKNVG